MSSLASHKSRFYSGLILFFLLLVPVCNLGAIRFGYRSLFHDEAELALYLLYAAPLWVGFILFLGIELYRQAVMNITAGHNLVAKMALGGFAFSAMAVMLCPVGPRLFSIAAVKLMLTSTVICGVLGISIRYLLRLRQANQI
jgi:hypothetical protein